MYPDGGIARLRVFGSVQPVWSASDKSQALDLAAVENGGVAVSWSDNHFGHPRNMLGPGRGVGMFDGWETARRRDRPPVRTLTYPNTNLAVPGISNLTLTDLAGALGGPRWTFAVCWLRVVRYPAGCGRCGTPLTSPR